MKTYIVLQYEPNFKEFKVKKIIISLLCLIVNGFILNAQYRNLDFYIGQAKKNSPLINQAKNENKLVYLDLQQMNKILYKPEINLVSGLTFSPIVSHDVGSSGLKLVSRDATDYIGHDLALTDGGQYQALVSLRQPLLTGSKYDAYVAKADISEKINANNISLTEHELEQIVGYQYLFCILSSKEAENMLSLVRDLEDQYKLLEKLVENGVYKQTDLMLMQLELENYNLEYKGYWSDYAANLYDLNLICGISDSTIVKLQDHEFSLNQTKVVESGFLTGYRLDSLSIISDLTIDELKYKPQLDLFTDVGLNASYLPYPKRLGLSFGLAFTWNIFDGNQREIQREKSAVNLQTIEFNKNNFMIQNQMNKNKVIAQIESIIDRIQLNETQQEQYQRIADAYLKELRLGEASVMDYKNLLNDIAVKKQELLQLNMEKQFLINSYNYLNF